MPFGALEHLFVFKTGDRSVLWESPTLAGKLKQIVGEELSVIRQKTPRDVIFNCELSHLFRRDGSISDAVWRAMSVRSPEVVNKARAKLSRTCVHSFQVEDDSVIAVVLFYDVRRCKQG